MIPTLTTLQADELAMRLAREHRARELEAMQVRWWDYRLMHPTTSTYVFAKAYVEATETWWRRHIDDRTPEKARAFECQDIFNSRDLTAVWLARQSADLMGLPYDFVMEFALARSLKREFRHLMRPNQFYGEEFETDIKAAWDEECLRGLRTSSLQFYKATYYRLHKMQDEYRAWIIDQVKRRPPPHYRLLARLFISGDVDEDMVRLHFSDVEVRQMQATLVLLSA